MALRWKSYLFTALILVSILSFGLDFRALRLSPKFKLSFLDNPNRSRPELAIHLHSKDHTTRAPQTLHFQWDITQGYGSPDGVRKLLYLINGAFPGPTIEARSGDTLIVEVHNGLEDEGVAIHWHGLHMRGANAMDGAVGITQNPISPGTNFTYEFQIGDDQSGTFWYHSHSGLQRADGVYGGLIIHEPKMDTMKDDFQDQTLLMIGDLYHRSAEEVQASYVNHESWGREPVPDSLLVNGKGKFNCSMAVPSRPLQCEDVPLPELSLPPGLSRMRIVNVGAMSGFVLNLNGCQMTVIEVDGGNAISPSSTSSSVGILYPGERVDMIIECDAASGPHLSVTLDPENFAIPNPALTPTHHFPLSLAPQLRLSKRGHSYHPPSIIPSEGFFDLSTATGILIPPNSMLETPSQTLVVYTKMEVLARLGNVPAGFINRTSWAVQSLPPQPLLELEREQYDVNQLVPWIPIEKGGEGKWIDIVVNNLDEKGHPFHLHGYDFLVLTSYTPPRRGYHAYNPFSTSPNASPGGPYNIRNPLKKDTVYVPSQGYVVLRIKADNPGVWFFHCHVLWHSGSGMGMALEVGYS